MIKNEIKYGYQDLTIVPETISEINSRAWCNPFCNDNKLPIFASPMSTITNEKNIDIWKKNHITPIIPRNINRDYRWQKCEEGEWVAMSLNEFKEAFINYMELGDNSIRKDKTYRVCVDLANGHMKSLYESINKAKELSRKYNYTLIIMTGNIANPETYRWICENAEVDYIRLSIGTGNNCITSTQTSIHYPIASLIDECYQFKKNVIKENDEFYIKDYIDIDSLDKKRKLVSRPYIVADGGIRGYADVIKALGLGADYVMIGSLFTGLLESAAPLDIECYNSHYKYSFDNETGKIFNGIEWTDWDIWTDNADRDDTKEIKLPHFHNQQYLEETKRSFIHDMKSITKESYGMSTKKAQKLINPNAQTKTSEGCTKYIQVKETVYQWTENMIAYFKSAMSYTNKQTLDDFKGHVNFVVNSSCAILAVNK